jgi:hypothetical protein
MRTIKTTTISILAVGLLAGSAGGVAAQDEEETAVVTSFTGVFSPDAEGLPNPAQTEGVLPNGFSWNNGFAWKTSWESSDERMAGDVTGVNHWVIDPAGFEPWSWGGQPNMLAREIVELTNDGGSWLGEGIGFNSTELDMASTTHIFVGRDGYEGLTAYVLVGEGQPPTFSGIIFPGEMPEAPEPLVAE